MGVGPFCVLTMDNTFTAFVAVEPLPCPRPRIRVRGKFGQAYYPAAYKKWRAAFIKALPSLTRTFTRACHVEIELVCTKARTSKLTLPKGDVDNYAKSILDSLTDAKLWLDDKQVARLEVTKRFANKGETAGIRLHVTENTWPDTNP